MSNVPDMSLSRLPRILMEISIIDDLSDCVAEYRMFRNCSEIYHDLRPWTEEDAIDQEGVLRTAQWRHASLILLRSLRGSS